MFEKFHPVHPVEEPPTNPVTPGEIGPHPIIAFLCVGAFATLASHLLPEAYASSGVATIFLGATYYLCLRHNHPVPPEQYGLSLGGLLSSEPLSLKHIVQSTLKAFVIASLIALIIFPVFAWGFVEWHEPPQEFSLARAFTWPSHSSIQVEPAEVKPAQSNLAPIVWLWEIALLHVVTIALPEEAFFRGYLQSSLSKRAEPSEGRSPIRASLSILVVSVFFALGHFATEPHPARLAVFFPSLLFGVVRNLSGGIGAAVFLHAECNIFSHWLSQGYGFH